MNRKEFLKNCACTVCSCAVSGAIAPAVFAGDEKKAPTDWQLLFVKDRYAKLIGILAEQVDEKVLAGVMRKLGSHCASQYPLIQQHKGDLSGFISEFKKRSNEEISYDSKNGVITVVGADRGDCFCPLVDRHVAPKSVCNCSLGWQQYTYETVLGKKVEVELKESVVHGGSRCVFQIRVLEAVASTVS